MEKSSLQWRATILETQWIAVLTAVCNFIS